MFRYVILEMEENIFFYFKIEYFIIIGGYWKLIVWNLNVYLFYSCKEIDVLLLNIFNIKIGIVISFVYWYFFIINVVIVIIVVLLFYVFNG